MASIPSNGYAEVMAGTNNYSGSNSFDGSCPRTAIPPVIGNDLTNKTYVDAATGGGILSTLTDKGSLITANGTNAVIFDQNPYQTALTTITVYDWNSLALGQSRNFTTTVPTLIPLGAGITITYSGSDSIKGIITAVAGTTITITITALASATYTPATLLTTLPANTTDPISAGNTTLAVTTAITTPNPPNIPANTIITQGVANVYSFAFFGITNFSITLSGTNVVRGQSNTQNAPLITTTTAIQFDGANGGCFFGSTQTPVITVTSSLNALIGENIGLSVPPDFVGSLAGYTLSYGTGSIVIDDDIALVADPLSSTGLAWGIINTASITDTDANATYFPVFVASNGSQPLLINKTTTPISINPNTSAFNVGTTLKLTTSQLAVGEGAGQTSQAVNGVAIGVNAGNASQANNGIAIGNRAGETSQGVNSIAIGANAGNATQTTQAIAIGLNSGRTTQGSSTVAIGVAAGTFNQGAGSIAIGGNAGAGVSALNFQGANCVAIGSSAGQNTQGSAAVSIGNTAGQTSQAVNGVAIGANSGNASQGNNSIAIGLNAGQTSQGVNCIAIGAIAGSATQTTQAIAIGVNSGRTTQGSSAVAIGANAGETSQGITAVAIGYLAGQTNQTAGSIAINGSGVALNPTTAGCYIRPIRGVALGIGVGRVFYDAATFELQYSTT